MKLKDIAKEIKKYERFSLQIYNTITREYRFAIQEKSTGILWTSLSKDLENSKLKFLLDYEIKSVKRCKIFGTLQIYLYEDMLNEVEYITFEDFDREVKAYEPYTNITYNMILDCTFSARIRKNSLGQYIIPNIIRAQFFTKDDVLILETDGTITPYNKDVFHLRHRSTEEI